MQGETDGAPNETAQTTELEGNSDEAALAGHPDVTTPRAQEAVAAKNVPADPSTSAEATSAPTAAPTNAPGPAFPSAPPAPGAKHSLTDNRLWILLGLLLLFVLLLPLLAVVSNRSQGTLAEAQQDTVNLIQKVNPSVVQIQARSGASGGLGSGEIATTSGYIVTNSHVVSGFRDLSVLLSDGRQVPAQLVSDVPEEDLAVIKISVSNLKPIAFGDSSKVQVGDFALALGSPLGLEQSATTGIVSALNRTASVVTNGRLVTLRGMLQTSAPINPGNSGGALINAQGELIGIPTLGAVDPTSGAAANGIGFAITSNHAREILARFER
jgi:S1-C subfamily serine protease